MSVFIHHIEINVTDIERSFNFYRCLFDFLGHQRSERRQRYFIFYFDTLYMHVNECHEEHKAMGFHRYRPGLNHLAFKAESREQIDACYRLLRDRELKVLDPPGYYGDGYYAVYFADPDDI